MSKLNALFRPFNRVALLLGIALSPALQAVETTQSLSLTPGWNAIWLNVDPLDDEGNPKSVETIFNNAAISYVATPRLPVGTAEFIAELAEGNFNQTSWKTWRRSSELGAVSLAGVTGYRAYLVKVERSANINLEITGEARFHQTEWTANSYNLIGFGLTQEDTFTNFFAGFSATHPTNKIFRLAPDGNWVGVSASDAMKPGEAYWVYSDGASSFAGPVAISFENFDGLNFGPGPGETMVPDPDGGVGTIGITLSELTFKNLSSSGQTVRLEKVAPGTTTTAATDDLRIYDVTPEPNLENYSIGSQLTSTEVATLSSGATESITLGAHRNWNSGARERENLYRIVIGKLAFWLPIRAQNADILDFGVGSGNPSYQGLWIGDAVVNRVSSVSESGRPVKNATTAAPLRFIFFVDSAGSVSLLSSVTIMQTKRASPEDTPVPVLVVDDRKIPFFEGIEERAGNLVGKRYESVSYDMPRRIDLSNQASLLDDVINLSDLDALEALDDVTVSDLTNFINSRTSRPPELVEDYHLSWPFTGGFGPNNAIATAGDSPLLLDPFHRSNPFRHAFHRKHVAGFPVSRSIQIGFDSEQQEGRLTGTFSETLSGGGGVSGLASFDILTGGTITLQRISEVGTIE